MNITVVSVGKIKEKYLNQEQMNFQRDTNTYQIYQNLMMKNVLKNLSEKDMLIVKDKEGKKSKVR